MQRCARKECEDRLDLEVHVKRDRAVRHALQLDLLKDELVLLARLRQRRNVDLACADRIVERGHVEIVDAYLDGLSRLVLEVALEVVRLFPLRVERPPAHLAPPHERLVDLDEAVWVGEAVPIGREQVGAFVQHEDQGAGWARRIVAEHARVPSRFRQHIHKAQQLGADGTGYFSDRVHILLRRRQFLHGHRGRCGTLPVIDRGHLR